MAGCWTNRGLYRMAELGLFGTWNGGSAPTSFKLMILDSTSPEPDKDTETITGDSLVEITAGNGYPAGGADVPRSSSGFGTVAIASNIISITLDDQVWTAVGGVLPASGLARYLVLTDDNATPGSREVLAYLDPATTASVLSGQTLTAKDGAIRLRNDGSGDGVQTDLFLARLLELMCLGTWNGGSAPTEFKLVPLASTSSDLAKTQTTFSGLTEIAAGNGYTSGGITVARSSSGFGTMSVASNIITIPIQDVSITASGGTVPSSGLGGYWVLTDNGGTLSAREVYTRHGSATEPSVSDGNTWTASGQAIRLLNNAA